MSGLQELAEGLWVSQTPLWQTNALLARSGSDALLCDPCYTPDEIEHLVARAREGQGPIHLLLTHGDFDHTCGIGFVPEAVVVAGASTAARIASGTAEEELVAAGAEWGVTWPDGLRVDRVVEAGAFECGAFRVEAIEATGHTTDGLAFVLVDQGVLLPGDYLSEMTYPFIGGGLAATIGDDATAARRARATRAALGRARPRSRRSTPEEATAVGEADLAYLEALARAVGENRERGRPEPPARRCCTSTRSSRRETRRPTSRSTGSAPQTREACWPCLSTSRSSPVRARASGSRSPARLAQTAIGLCLVAAPDDQEQLERGRRPSWTQSRSPRDVGDPETAERAVELTLERFGRLDRLASNAGIAYFEHVLDVAARALRPHDARQRPRHVPHDDRRRAGTWRRTAAARSSAPRPPRRSLGEELQAIYNASKGAVAQLARSLAVDLAPPRHPGQRGRARLGANAARRRRS